MMVGSKNKEGRMVRLRSPTKEVKSDAREKHIEMLNNSAFQGGEKRGEMFYNSAF
jgi:hypothetical protein